MFLRIFRLAVLPLFGLLFSSLAAPQQASGEPELQVQMSLNSNSTFSLGEPIVLKYKILNTSIDRAETYTGTDQKGWITETLSDAQGHVVPIEATHLWHQSGGAHMDSVSVSPSASATGYVVFDPWATVQAAGKYKFSVHTRLPYALGAQAEEVARDRYEDTGDVAVGDFTFSLVVTPRASQSLKRAAEILKRNVQDAKLHDWSSAFVEALFSMPEADVSSVWQELISDPSTSAFVLGLAAEQLARLHSITAADLVAQMRWGAARPLKAGETPLGAVELDRMFQFGDAELRKHIDSLYAAHGESHEYSLVVAD